MLNSKIFLTFILLIGVLSGCRSSETVKSEVADMDLHETAETIYETSPVIYGSISDQARATGRIFFPVIESVRFTKSGGRLVDVYVMLGEEVSKGDVLAEISFDTEQINAEINKSKISIEQDILNQQLERTKKEDYIKELSLGLSDLMRENINGKNDTAIRIQNLRIRRAKAEFDFYLYESEDAIKDKREALEELSQKLDYEKITAPFDGMIVYINSDATKGKQITPNDNLVMVAANSRLMFRTDEDIQLRYGTPVTYSIGGINFENVLTGSVVNDITVPGSLDKSSICEVVGDIPMISFGGNVLAQYNRSEFSGILVCDSSAINNSEAGQFVYVIEDNIAKKRFVKTGLSTNNNVQILYGVDEGDLLALK